MTQATISIIVPHFNSVQGVLRLLDSIPANDPEVEVLVVDDRSTVEITPLRQAIAARDNARLLVNSSPNKGAGAARNVGLAHASGKWLLFADADDYFLPGWLDVVLEYREEKADLIYFSPISFNVQTGGVGARHRHYEELVKAHAAKPDARSENELRYGFYTPWSKLIQHKVFTENHILFDETLVANDVMAMTKCAFYSRHILADPRTIYCVTSGEKTLTSKKNKDNFDTRINIKIRRYLFLRQHLSSKAFRQTHADYYMAGSLADALLGGWGLQTVREILKKYRENHVKFFSLSMLEPRFLLHYIWLDIKWRKETNG